MPSSQQLFPAALPVDLVTEAAVIQQLVHETGRPAASIRSALRRHLRRVGAPVTKVGLTRIFPVAALRPRGEAAPVDGVPRV